VLAGALRPIVGRLTIEEIIRDRAAFASAVAEEAESSLTGQGLVLDTFQLQDIQAEGTYLADLGRPEAARVLKEASIAESRARRGPAGAAAGRRGDRGVPAPARAEQAEIDAAKARAAGGRGQDDGHLRRRRRRPGPLGRRERRPGPAAVRDLTGLDVGALLRRLGKGAADVVEGGTSSSPAVTRVRLDGHGAGPDRG
jgi:regulator of protease activity HflC (stomatin/prohibitin superfamily)